MRRIKADWRDADLYKGAEYLLADPPWIYGDKPPKADAQVGSKYTIWGDHLTGNGGEIARMFFNIAPCTGVVFLWCTWPIMEEVVSTLRNCIYEDKFTLRTVITWIKLKSKGGLSYGLGNSARGVTEPLLVYVRKGARPPRLQIPNVFSEFSGKRTRKPKNFERELVRMLPGDWLYMFSGPETEWAKGLDIDLVDKCHDFKAGRKGLLR